MITTFRTIPRILISIAIIYTASFASDEPVNPSWWRYSLEEVTVTAERLSARTGAFTVFDSTRISEQQGLTLSELLDNTPGGVIAIGSRNEAQFNIRGAIGRDTRLYIDGRPASSPWNGYIDLSGISLNNIAKVTIIKGPPPLRYGSNLGGAVNITTAQPSAEPSAGFHAEYGSGEIYGASLTGSRKIYGKLSARATLFTEGRKGFPLPDDYKAEYENGSLRDYSEHNKIGGSVCFHLPLEVGETSLSAGYSTLEKDIPPNAIEFPRYWKFKDWSRYYTDIKLRKTSDFYEFESGLYFDGYSNRMKRYYDDTFDDSNYMYDSIHSGGTAGWSGCYRKKWKGGHYAEAGTRLNYDWINRKEQTPTSGGFSDPLENHSYRTDVFLEGMYKPARMTEVSAGISALHKTLEDDNSELYPAGRVGFAVNPLKKLRLAVNIGHSVQYPTFFHLYDASSGNPDLEPETAWRGEIGAMFCAGKGVSIALWHYRSFIDGRIDRIDRNSQYENLVDVELQGEELVIEKRGKRYTAELAVVRQEVDLESIPGTSYSFIGDGIPPWKADLRYSRKLPWDTKLSLSAGYVAEVEDYQGHKLREHTLIDFSVSHKISKWLEAKVSVENALDEEHCSEYGFPMPGRVFRGGIDVTLGKR